MAVLLVLVLLISSCSSASNENSASNLSNESLVTESKSENDDGKNMSEKTEQDDDSFDEDALIDNPEPANSKSEPEEHSFTDLKDPNLINYYEQAIFAEVSNRLGEEYTVDNVSAAYISKEYIEELTYNSQSNIFFGYSLAELDAEFNGTRYVFTLGKNGETVVVPFEAYDSTYEKVLKNVAIGTGVILICVTVSAVTAGAGAPAVSMIFAASAKSGAIFAASSGALSAVIAGTVTGIETGSFDEAIKAGALAGSESFKWGAITGAVMGGSSELITLKSAASGGLTLDEAAILMKEEGLSSNFLKQIHSIEEYNELVSIAEANELTIQNLAQISQATGYPLEIVKMMKSTKEGMVYFEQAGLYAKSINGQTALIRSIDLNYKSTLAGKTVTNLERMRLGYPAIDPVTGKAFQLHHIGQKVDSPLAILTQFEHTGGGNKSLLHDPNIVEGVHKNLPDAVWAAQKREFWKALAKLLAG